jgi:hypothetical protein
MVFLSILAFHGLKFRWLSCLMHKQRQNRAMSDYLHVTVLLVKIVSTVELNGPCVSDYVGAALYGQTFMHVEQSVPFSHQN